MITRNETIASAPAVGSALLTERERRHWTAAETGSEIGLSVSVLSRAERSARPWDTCGLVGLCAVLEVPPVSMIAAARDEAFPLGWPGGDS